jgi:hypothetical protein
MRLQPAVAAVAAVAAVPAAAGNVPRAAVHDGAPVPPNAAMLQFQQQSPEFVELEQQFITRQLVQFE